MSDYEGIASDDNSWQPSSDLELEEEMNLMRLGRSASIKSLNAEISSDTNISNVSTISSSVESIGRGIDINASESGSSWISTSSHNSETGMNSSQDSEGNPIARCMSYFLLNEDTQMQNKDKLELKVKETVNENAARVRAKYPQDFCSIERQELQEEVYDESNPVIIYNGKIPIFRDPKYFKAKLVDPKAFEKPQNEDKLELKMKETVNENASRVRAKYPPDFCSIERQELQEEVYDESNPGIIYSGKIPIFRDPKYFKARLVDPEAFEKSQQKEMRRKRRQERKMLESQEKFKGAEFTKEYMQTWENYKIRMLKKLERQNRKRENKLIQNDHNQAENPGSCTSLQNGTTKRHSNKAMANELLN